MQQSNRNTKIKSDKSDKYENGSQLFSFPLSIAFEWLFNSKSHHECWTPILSITFIGRFP